MQLRAVEAGSVQYVVLVNSKCARVAVHQRCHCRRCIRTYMLQGVRAAVTFSVVQGLDSTCIGVYPDGSKEQKRWKKRK